MNSKFKVIAPAAFAVMGSGGAVPLSGKLDFSWIALTGGGIDSLKIKETFESTGEKLGLNTQIIKQSSRQEITPDATVQLQSLTQEWLVPQKLETVDSAQQATNLFKEIKKEKEVIKIEGDSQNKVIQSKSKIKPQEFQQFQSATSKVQLYSKSNLSGLSPRSSGRPTSSHIQKLSEEEKKSMNSFFTEFTSLNKESKSFSENLRKVTQDEVVDISTSTDCLSCISKNLKTIGWTSKDLNLYEKISRFRSSPINPYSYYSNTRAFEKDKAKTIWGNWTGISHPYHSFFSSEEEWLSSVERISRIWKAYYERINSRSRIACFVLTFPLGVGLSNSCSANKSQLEKEIDNSKASLELQIGTKLMTIMNRFK